MAKSLVAIAEHNGKGLGLLKQLINLELRESSKGTLFRTASISSKVMKTYSTLVGSQYIAETLSPLISRLQTSEAKSYEVPMVLSLLIADRSMSARLT